MNGFPRIDCTDYTDDDWNRLDAVSLVLENATEPLTPSVIARKIKSETWQVRHDLTFLAGEALAVPTSRNQIARWSRR